jgi:hypothetical protein
MINLGKPYKVPVIRCDGCNIVVCLYSSWVILEYLVTCSDRVVCAGCEMREFHFVRES